MISRMVVAPILALDAAPCHNEKLRLVLAFRTEWLKTRAQLLAQVKRQVRRRLGRAPRDLASYIRRYNAEFSRPWLSSNHHQLVAAVEAADVVLGADFHAFAQSQRIHLRILRAVQREPVILALEALTTNDQTHIDEFMAGRLPERDFLQKVKWNQRWGFPWENYKPLFELAIERGFQVVGIERKRPTSQAQPLFHRDQHSATVIREWRKRCPDALIYVIIGDLHLAHRHLPSALVPRDKVKTPVRVLKILQNSEHLYFRLARSGREHQVEVMRAKNDRFCVLGSPPWVKWQSYLMYLEQTYDRDLDAGGVDFTDYVASFAVFMARDLGLTLTLENLSVVTLDQGKGWREISRGLDVSGRRLVRVLIENERSFFLPQAQRLFLARTSINHAATLAGYYLHAHHCELTRSPWRFPAEFEAQIWIEAVGFFCSKLINHKRKADTLTELKDQLAEERNARTKEVLRLAIAQRQLELHPRQKQIRMKPRWKESYLEAARIVGAMLGENLYQAVAEKKLRLKTVGEWLKVNPLHSEFQVSYYRWVRELVGRRS